MPKVSDQSAILEAPKSGNTVAHMSTRPKTSFVGCVWSTAQVNVFHKARGIYPAMDQLIIEGKEMFIYGLSLPHEGFAAFGQVSCIKEPCLFC